MERQQKFCPAGVLINSPDEFLSGIIEIGQPYLTDAQGRRVVLETQFPESVITDGEGECGFEKIGAKLDLGAESAARRCSLCKNICRGRAIVTNETSLPKALEP